ncbi:DUF5119 domain-containing protein [Bacteroides fragilis]|uniref:DUF5119 domain-containing protein n=1 Tax=Bacteroides fragilis TaxID=817 RepID=UPI00202E8EF0|nr:DUF5119 domain-containing protein [Bacteroides fragilis]MCM0231851.1 DUF5119 domain-containing protein [Bacteroides fragilis]
MSTVDKLTRKRSDKGLRYARFVFRQKNKRTYYPLSVLLLVCLFLFSGCDRRELTYSDEAEITLTADWSKASLSEQEGRYGATAVFYPTDGSTPITVLMGDRNRKTVWLKEGRYNIVLFNRSFDDFGSIAFRGTDAHHTLEAYAKNAQTKGTDSGKVATDSPDELAADCVEGFEVTADMLGNYSASATRSTETNKPCQLCFTPRKLTKEITATIHIKGMNNIRSATCTLGGVSESVFLASGKASERTMTQQFGLDRKDYLPGSQTEGTMSATFSVFGFDESVLHEVYFEAQLVDGKTEFIEELDDIKVNVSEDGEGAVRITIDVVCGETVPTVKPEGSSGMDADVDGWNEEDDKEIDI